MLTYQEALQILKGFKIEPPHDWDKHCITVGEIAYKLARVLSSSININPEAVRVMGLAHDFGRSITQDPYKHSYEGHKLFIKLGQPELARISTCHSNGTYKIEHLKEYDLIPEDFYVRTWEEKLVFMADNMERKGEIIRNDERILGTIERYRDKNPEFICILESKISEFKEFDEEYKALCGKSCYEVLGI
jgi:putative nucleotidyltransferase with HDIG domain